MSKTYWVYTKNRGFAGENLVVSCDFFILNGVKHEGSVFFFNDAFSLEAFKKNHPEAVEIAESAVNEKNENGEPCDLNCGIEFSPLEEKIRLAAGCDRPVLITGESGTGKTFVARKIHELSGRKNGPLFEVNVAGVNESLAESELFGSVSGAFTGSRDRKGYFLSADKGTLFLDEIGEISRELQVKLLWAIENKKVRPVGCDGEKRTDCRLICATNADLEKKMKLGEFRKDLYYRIAGIVIELKPLRQRKGEIAGLCENYLKKFNKVLSKTALDFIETCSWPGNIRQLFSCLDIACLKSHSSVIRLEDIEV